MTEEKKQKQREYDKRYKDNMTDEQKQKHRDYQREYMRNMTDEQKQIKKLISDIEII